VPILFSTATVLLDAGDTAGHLGQSAADVDVVLDYLWSEPTTAAMIAVLTNRADRGRPAALLDR